MRLGARRRGGALAALALCSISLCGCAAGYVVRAAYEEARLLWRRQPIEQVLAAQETDASTRAKLELALDARRFAAADLALDVGGSYTSVATVDASQVVHVVSAAPRDRLVPYTWWFPIVGRVPYRAYFDVADAHALAADLDAEGYDTYVRPAVAFSTLGWFDDPLLSTLLRYDDERLVETIIHELLHNTIYLSGQTAFNESFATFVGHRGAGQFFLARADTDSAHTAAARWADALTYSAFLGQLIAELRTAYATGISLDQRAALFDRARTEFAAQRWESDEYAGFEKAPLNNAVILHDQLYADRLAMFEAAAARNGGDLRVTIAWIRAQVADAKDPFGTLEKAVAGAPPVEGRASARPSQLAAS